MTGVLRTWRYRLYPAPAQERALLAHMEAARMVFNATLRAHRQAVHDQTDEPARSDLQHRLVTVARRTNPLLAAAPAVALQQAVIEADRLCHAARYGQGPWPRRRRQPPPVRFVGSAVSLPCGVRRYARVEVPKVGPVRVRVHRALPLAPTSATVTRSVSGEWHIAYTIRLPASNTEVAPVRVAALDLGVTHLASVVSINFASGAVDRWRIENPRFGREASAMLTKAQQVVERRVPGSQGHRAAVRRLAQARGRLARRRRDFLRKAASELLYDHDVVAVERLSVATMLRTGDVTPVALLDASMAMFVQCLDESAAMRGRVVVPLRAAGTSKTCAVCRRIREAMPLSMRAWRCDGCGATLDRDFNAAVNVLTRYLDSATSGAEAVTRVQRVALAGVPGGSSGAAHLSKAGGSASASCCPRPGDTPAYTAST